MIAAAAIPWPTTSPTTRPMRPPTSGKTSYQSPPRLPPEAGRERLAICRPGAPGGPAEASARGGQVAAVDLQAGALRAPDGEQAALQRLGHTALLVQPRVLDGEGGAVGGELEQDAVVAAELAWGEAADVQDADGVAF